MTSPRLVVPAICTHEPPAGNVPRRETIMPIGNADWLRRATPITPTPITIGRSSTILFHPEVMPLALHIAGACNACLPYADTICLFLPGNTDFLSTLSRGRLPQMC